MITKLSKSLYAASGLSSLFVSTSKSTKSPQINENRTVLAAKFIRQFIHQIRF
ncbi:hypothetical protein [Moraxella caviae]|uniref:hypothetical protein n=1 Tax=Moraxella caviae TaxID=34060 RepID=UPI001301384A|nr:hypothetical protein [Moraxella caviae]